MIIHIELPFQTVFTIVTDCPQLLSSLSTEYGKYCMLSEEKSGFVIEVLKNENLFEVTYDNIISKTSNPIKLIHNIMYKYRKYDCNYFVIHGAAIEYNKTAIIFVAPTMGGKTTLTTYLTLNGYGYITDDCVLVRKSDFQVFPCTTPLHLRRKGVDVLQANKLFIKGLEEDSALERLIYKPKNCIVEPLPLNSIYFIKHSKENMIFKMTFEEKIECLLKAPITNYNIDSKYFDFIFKISQFPCQRINYSELEFVEEVIKNV